MRIEPGPRPSLDLRDPELSLTLAQQSAMALGENLVLSAGAGSGKTHTLALRFVSQCLYLAVEAVLKPESPAPGIDTLLVLTFTDRAAEEMAGRCYQRLQELVATARHQQEELSESIGVRAAAELPRALERLLDQFEAANISTFHGFCARLLREFPAECSTPPNVAILESAEATILRESSIALSLNSLLREAPQDLSSLLHALGSWERVTGALHQILSRWSVLETRVEAYAQGEVDPETWTADALLSPEDALEWLEQEGLPKLRAFSALFGPGLGGVHVQQVILPLVGSLEDSPLPRDELGIFSLYQQVLGALAKDGRVRSLGHHTLLGTRGSWPDADLWSSAKVQALALKDACESWGPRLAEAEMLPGETDSAMIPVLEKLCQRAMVAREHLLQSFLDGGCLDFDELQHRAVRAIETNPGLAARLQERFSSIMVDEFQDTDERQWSLLSTLGGLDPTTGRLFLVGDVKQAIYGFRGGDVTVFGSAAQALGIDALVLPENFRSRPELIDVFNDLFQSVLGPPGERPPWEASYAPLVAGRPETGGSVRVLTHGGGRGRSDSEREAEAVANLLSREVLSGNSPWVELELQDRQRHPSPPVAILLRSRSRLGIYEAALRKAGVPFTVAKGIGFWSRPEVLDLVNALHGLATGDPLSVLGWLRSPLAAVEDQALFDFASGRWNPAGSGSREPFGVFSELELDPEAPESLRRAQATWQRLLSMRHRVRPPALIRLLQEACAAPHVYAREETEERALANTERLLSLAQRALGGHPDLASLSQFLLDAVLTARRESEAEVQVSAARVVVLTAHASKGLEFPVVILPELGADSRVDSDPLAIARLSGWELACTVQDPDASVQKRHQPARWKRLKNQRGLEEEAEQKRLFYVACTRARDHLVLVGGDRPSSRGSRWMDWLIAHYGHPLASGKTLQVYPITEGRPVPHRPAAAPPVAVPRDLSAPLPQPPEELLLTPSALDLFRECPAQWEIARRLGLSATPPVKPGGQGDLGRLRGICLHALFESGRLDAEEGRRQWQALAAAEGLSEGPEEVLRHLEGARLHRDLQSLLSVPGWAELPFSAPVGAAVFRGVIDRLLVDEESGESTILDFKTGSVSAADVPTAARAHRSQMLAYSWAANQVLLAHDQPPVTRALLYFSDPAILHALPPWTAGDFQEFEGMVQEVYAQSTQPWQVVLDAQISAAGDRPCNTCAFRGRACPGRPASAPH